MTEQFELQPRPFRRTPTTATFRHQFQLHVLGDIPSWLHVLPFDSRKELGILCSAWRPDCLCGSPSVQLVVHRIVLPFNVIILPLNHCSPSATLASNTIRLHSFQPLATLCRFLIRIVSVPSSTFSESFHSGSQCVFQPSFTIPLNINNL